jgi:Protein phosphatase 2C
MSHSRGQARTPAESAVPVARSEVRQWILLVTLLILVGFAVFAEYRHQQLTADVLWIGSAGAFVAFLAGVWKIQGPGLRAKIKGRNPEQRPDPGQHQEPPEHSHQDFPASPAMRSAAQQQAPAPQAAGLGEPPVFAGRSASGRAPWHLPVGGAPNGLAADAARLGDLEIRAASMVGAGHRCEEPAYPRQDAYALGRTPDGQYLVVAVADGVSQSPRSDLGARVAVSAAARELSGMLDRGGIEAIDVGRLYKIVAGEMIGTGRNRGIPDEDICSILITAVIPAAPRDDGSRPIWASWIGDVSLWVQHEGRLIRLTGADKSGLDRNTLSAVLPFNPDQADQRHVKLLPYDAVAVMTDGLSDSLAAVPGVADFFAAQWAGPPPHPAAFLHSLCYDAPGQDDDRTAVVVWCGDRNPARASADRRP